MRRRRAGAAVAYFLAMLAARERGAVVLAMGPWTSRVAGRLPLPRVGGLEGHSITLAGADVPAHALFVDYRTADGRRLEPEIFPRASGEVYVGGMADPQPLPDSPEEVAVSEAACATLARATGLALAELITAGAAASVDLRPFDPARLPAAAPSRRGRRGERRREGPRLTLRAVRHRV